MAGLVKKIFTEIEVEVEVGEKSPVIFNFKRLQKSEKFALNKLISMNRLRDIVEQKRMMGEKLDDKDLKPVELEAIGTDMVLVKDYIEPNLLGWSGVPDVDDKPLAFSAETVADLLEDDTWRDVLDQAFWAGQDEVPEIITKNVSTPANGGQALA